MAKSPEKPNTLPATLVSALPVAVLFMNHVREIEALIPQLNKELTKAEKQGAIALARAFVVLHRTNERLKEMAKAFAGPFELYKVVKVPEALEQAGITNVPLAEGYRVQVSMNYRASIKKDEKDGAYEWLAKNGLEALITETVNASTLSAAAKAYMEDQGKEFPDGLFEVAFVPNTSVVSTK